MVFVVKSVSRVAESAGFRVIGCFESETEEEKNDILPVLCDGMKDLLGYYAVEVQPEVAKNVREDGVEEDSIYYRIISLPELKFVLKVYKENIGIKNVHAELSKSVEYFPEDIRKIFEFQMQCWKQASGF